MSVSYNWTDIKGTTHKKYNAIKRRKENVTRTSEVNSLSEKISRRTSQRKGNSSEVGTIKKTARLVPSFTSSRLKWKKDAVSVIKTNARGHNEGRDPRSQNVTGNECAFRKIQQHRQQK